MWRKRGDDLTVEKRNATSQAGNAYTDELLSRFADREADMRVAYTEFAPAPGEHGMILLMRWPPSGDADLGAIGPADDVSPQRRRAAT